MDYGLNCRNLVNAKMAVEYCRFIYKAYAQTCAFPLDPFYEARGEATKIAGTPRTRLMASIHKEDGTNRKMDPIKYLTASTPNPHKSTVFSGQEKAANGKYYLLQPRRVDQQILRARGFNIGGTGLDELTLVAAISNDKCGYFQGRTGQTVERRQGWLTYLGAVIRSGTITWIVFRGSRSGDPGRAVKEALMQNRGNPDWITDVQMNRMTEATFDKNITLASGFYFAYQSCVKSLVEAYRYANENPPTEVIVTGHSMGGALAQIAYLDLAMGDIRKTFLDDHEIHLSQDIPISCYPISAPPVAIGLPSHARLSYRGGASHIHHFFAPTDPVHLGPIVQTVKVKGKGFEKVKSKAKAQFASSLWYGMRLIGDYLYHLGSETPLEKCTASGAAAHEPLEVYKAMQDDPGDLQHRDFWITILDDLKNGKAPWDVGPRSDLDEERHGQALWEALEIVGQIDEQRYDPFAKRAGDYCETAILNSDESRQLQKEARKAVTEYEDLVILLADDPTRRVHFKNTRDSWESHLLKDHGSTSRAYLILLLGLGVREILLGADPPRQPSLPGILGLRRVYPEIANPQIDADQEDQRREVEVAWPRPTRPRR